MVRERWLAVVGIGEDGVDGLSPAARRLVAQAAFVVGGRRHLALAGPLTAETLSGSPSGSLSLASTPLAAATASVVVRPAISISRRTRANSAACSGVGSGATVSVIKLIFGTQLG